MRRRTLLSLAGASAAGQFLAACFGSPAATPRPTSGASGPAMPAGAGAATPTTSGRIAVYSALAERANDQLLGAFRSAYPRIDVDVLSLAAATELQTRIRVEKAARKADLFVGGDSSLHDLLAREGLLDEYASPNAAGVVAAARDPDGFWTGWYLTVLGAAVNAPRLAAATGGGAPAAWDDLLAAVWRRKLVLPDPAKTSAGYAFLAAQAFRYARDDGRTMDYMKALELNGVQYVGSESRAFDLLSEGPSLCTVAWSHDVLARSEREPALELAVPDGAVLGIGAVSILKGTGSAAAARAFVDWTLTRGAAELNVRVGRVFPVRADVAPPAGAPPFDRVKLVSWDRAWADGEHDRLVREWQAAVRR